MRRAQDAVLPLLLVLAIAFVANAAQAASKSKEPAGTKTKVALSEIEISAIDPDSGKATATQKVAPGKKLASVFNVAENQKFLIKFSVRAGDKAVKADQAFVRLTHAKAGRELVFVGEVDGDGYKVDLDTAKRANDFGRLAGSYDLRIDVGDVNFANAISAHLGTVKLDFVSGVTELPDPLARYNSKPEIQHLFREPEKRPPAVVSTAFAFGVLVPVLILLGLWAKLGLNLRNFDFHPASLVFYASLGGIFYLYFQFWIHLNMFTTLKYLTGLGVVACLSGSMMYSRMHRRRTGKETKSE